MNYKKQNIKVIILAGSRDFGRCPIATRLPTALWPIAGKPVLEHLLSHLAKQGIKQATICSNGDGSLLAESIQANGHLELNFLDEPLPAGTAGCIRDAAGNEKDTLFLIFPASIVCPPKIDVLINAHRNAQSDLTVMFNPDYKNSNLIGKPAGIYICEDSILEHIPKKGYFDIKEGLIPDLLRAGKTIHTAILPHHAGNFRDRQEYLYAIANYLEYAPKLNSGLILYKRTDSQIIWKAADAKIDPNAGIYGPVVIMNGACIHNDVVIFGPAIIGMDVTIREHSIVANSVLWDGAQVGRNCQVQRCVADYHAVVRSNSVVEEKSIPFKPEGVLKSSVSKIIKIAKNNATISRLVLQPQFDKINEKLPKQLSSHKRNILQWLAGGLVLIAFLWSYWPGIIDICNIWQRSDEYSSGLLVPFLAVYILWSRRQELAGVRIRPSVWGLFAFVAAQAVRLFGLFFMYSSAERLSLVLSIAALVLLLFGWRFSRKVSTVLLFSCLMLPWPNRVQAAVALPLQRWATSSAIFCLEMAGHEVMQEGNIIHIGQATVAVAEACNGLRMITAFFVISGLVILLVKRTWWEKLIILASSLPIALLCNTVRLTITAIAFTVLGGEQWEKIFHDFGGYAMMPLALAAIVAELWLLTKLTTLPTKKEAIIITRQT
jgi:exosortase